MESTIQIDKKDHRKNNIIKLSPLVVKRVQNTAIQYVERCGGTRIATLRMSREERAKRRKIDPLFDAKRNFGLKYHLLIVECVKQNIIGLPCYHCRKVIEIGSMCYSQIKGYNTRSYYHIPCAEKINLI